MIWFGVWCLIRVCLSWAAFHHDAAFILATPEISTAACSWVRLTEGASLFLGGVNPYKNNFFHDSPISLLFRLALGKDGLHTDVAFVVVEVLTALLLSRACDSRQKLVFWLYLLNPLTTWSSLARSSQALSNLLVAASLYCLQRCQSTFAAFSLSLSTVHCLSTCFLLPAFILRHHEPRAILSFAFMFIISLFGLASVCFHLYGESWLAATVGNNLMLSEVFPGPGVTWYLFVEMFSFFDTFFACVFASFLVTITMISTSRVKCPLLRTWATLVILAFWRPYSSFGDFIIPIALLPVFSESVRQSKFYVLTSATVVIALSLLPGFRYTWLYQGSGNANFYFAASLVSVVAGAVFTSNVLKVSM